jgi:hypothetical protein
MKSLIAALVALTMVAGTANAASNTTVAADNSVMEWCNDYRGH